jgi:hypothetical protein
MLNRPSPREELSATKKAVLVGLGLLVIVFCLVMVNNHFGQRSLDKRGLNADTSSDERREPESDSAPLDPSRATRVAAFSSPSSSHARSNVHADIPSVFRALRVTTASATESVKRLGVEAQANAAEPYLIGMIQAIRAIDPNILTALRDVYADELCGSGDIPREQVMTYARAVMFEARLGSARGLECALKQNAREDVVLWSLLDAWNSTGRDPLPILATIGAAATDERTRRRLDPDRGNMLKTALAGAAQGSDIQRTADGVVSRTMDTNQ